MHEAVILLEGSDQTSNISMEKMSLPVLVFLLSVSCVDQCVCFPNGSVASSCGDLLPVHRPFTPSTSSPPFTVSTSSSTYRPGDVITVTVAVVDNSSSQFQGFLLQARSRTQQALLWPVGKFTNINASQVTALHCKNMENSTVSQASADRRTNIQLTWEAPSSSSYGDVYFSASLVQDYSRFWVGLNSSSVRLDVSGGSAVSSSSSALLFISLLSLSVYC